MGVIEMIKEQARQEERAKKEKERARESALKAEKSAKDLVDLQYKITKNLLTQTNMPAYDIARVAGVSEYYVRKVKRELKREQAIG
ncbi:hypothetical protein GCM10027566_25440 [Arachidicoccus ginsenosidivorans]|uniref:Uncharacterized protein n=1 Tax=Arachidicoccus ginsenosidivorans TaxID=496057 RepID=A0A5B8VKM2_9BACT|nr:hypothetical protein [Arachidicoccus ginsenosidivorans]QEC71156.1 hypothetical protein FSB73_05150 [Arachidicoccus ginsenosidivorans]